MSDEVTGSSHVEAQGRRLAVVVGINGEPTPDRAPLLYAGEDAEAMAQVLQSEACGFELFAPPLLGEQATTAGIKDTVLDLADVLNEEDTALFYFSGHAEAMPTGADLDEVYLVSHDFKAARIQRDKDAQISLRWVRQILFEHEQAKSILIILDCCYAGKFRDSAPDPYLDALQHRLRYYFGEPGAESPARRGGVRLALTATGETVAKEADGHGLLTGHILSALCGEQEQAITAQGYVTFTSLFGYLDESMPLQQRPHFFGAGSSLILAKHLAFSREQRQKLEQGVRRVEREQRLRTMFSEHSGFLQDRLASFVGREEELREVHKRIEALLSTGGYLAITGQAGQGKSSVIAKLIEAQSQAQGNLERVAFHFIPLTPPPDYQVVLLRNLMARLILKYDLSDLYVASESRAALGEAFPRILQEIAEKGGRELIFIDGLDQLQTDPHTGWRDLSFLPQGPDRLPPGIAFVMGTRPNDTLRPLDLLKPAQEYRLPNLSRHDFNLILAHHRVILKRPLADRFYTMLGENALYLDLVAQELAVPQGLTDLYVEGIVRRLIDDPDNVFSLTIDRLRQQGSLWALVIKPVLGLLLAAQEPLMREQLKQLLNLAMKSNVDGELVNLGLERLGGLVIIDEQQRYSLFHLKFREHLSQKETSPKKNYVFDREDIQGWHARFIAWCEMYGMENIWEENTSSLFEKDRRRYARQHYITHLYHAHCWKQLFTVLDEGVYGKKKKRFDTGGQLYMQDLWYGCQAACWSDWTLEESLEHLVRLWRYTLLRCSLRNIVDQYPQQLFQTMLSLGKEKEVLNLTDLLTQPEKKIEILLLLIPVLMKQPEKRQDGMAIIRRIETIIWSLTDITLQAEAWKSLAVVLAQAHMGEYAEETFLHVERVAESIQDIEDRVNILKEIALALIQVHKQEHAQKIFLQAEALLRSLQNDSYTQSRALEEFASILIRAQQWEQAEKMARSIRDDQRRDGALSELVCALAQAQQWKQAELILPAIQDASSLASALCGLVSALTREQRRGYARRYIPQIEKQARSIREPQWQSVTWEKLASTLIQAHQWKKTEEIARNIQDIDIRVRVLAKLALELKKAKRMKYAGQIFLQAEEIAREKKEAEDRERMLIRLLSVLVEAQQWKQAEQLFHRLKMAIDAIGHSGWQSLLLEELTFVLAQAQQWKKAEEVARSISGTNRQAMALRHVASGLAQAQQWEQAKQIALSITRVEERIKALGDLALALTQAQQWEQAKQIALSITRVEERIKALSDLALALTQAQQWERTTPFIALIEAQYAASSYQQARALSEFATYLVLMEQQEYAYCFFNLAEEIVSTLSLEERVNGLHALILALVHVQQWEAVRRLLDEVEEAIECFVISQDRLEAFGDLAGALEQAQQPSHARRFFGLAWEAGTQILNQYQQIDLLDALLREEEMSTRVARIKDIFRSLPHSPLQTLAILIRSDHSPYSVDIDGGEEILTTLLKQARVQHWRKAEKIARTIQSESHYDAFRTLALVALATLLAQKGRWSEAERIAHSLGAFEQAAVLTDLGVGSMQVGFTEQATRFFRQSEEIINSIQRPRGQARALAVLAAGLSQAQQYEQVVALIQRSWQRTNTRDEAVQILLLTAGLIRFHHDLGASLFNVFQEVENFLQVSYEDPLEKATS
ncbi:hypothetical protein KSF_085140 [Reticulibacter mediterranei]|uniref:NACHT domain-containing protein n=1 Tax=Reticulibacter mediterranei TaxID=2778369 RepID=A0A8J3J083_9CHLR|nr:AAA family ATPase [Reticulibacter mediterranei]GHO98466.1 hypothetical protein KSF_085140 [Reticulibacter mediterranei]